MFFIGYLVIGLFVAWLLAVKCDLSFPDLLDLREGLTVLAVILLWPIVVCIIVLEGL